MAAKAGAWCVSPFIGRLDDISTNGSDIIRQILTIYRDYDYQLQVLVASVRHPQHVVVKAAWQGIIFAPCHTVFFQLLVKHPLTDIGLKKFLADWKAQGMN